ncbi:uncharacterized protein LOC127746693 [Arachis duranensis]|uniref:Uncharacterized protein LOC127746693 n=1 Tax=Arachis duranensis TaxID=130453 RepID=A0A9C6THF3_ARADU|nr:uncharacterized protein LOC127746693 [Arachis duranensis]
MKTAERRTAQEPANRLKTGRLDRTAPTPFIYQSSSEHLQWRRRTLAALPEPSFAILRPLSPSFAPVVSPSSAPATLQSPSSPGSCPVALNFHRLHLLKSQHQHVVASHRRSSTGNTGSTPSTPVMEDSINQEATADNNASVNNNMLMLGSNIYICFYYYLTFEFGF